MKRIALAALALFLFCTPAFAGLDDFLTNLNIQARADMNGFAARVSTQFGVPEVQVRTVIGTVKEPAVPRSTSRPSTANSFRVSSK